MKRVMNVIGILFEPIVVVVGGIGILIGKVVALILSIASFVLVLATLWTVWQTLFIQWRPIEAIVAFVFNMALVWALFALSRLINYFTGP